MVLGKSTPMNSTQMSLGKKIFTCNFLPRGLELVGPRVVPVDVNGTEEELLVKASAQSWLTWSEM